MAPHRLLVALATVALLAACAPTVKIEPPDKPIVINLNISGELDTMLQRGLESYRIPDVIAEQLRKFGG